MLRGAQHDINEVARIAIFSLRRERFGFDAA